MASDRPPTAPPSASALRATFDAAEPLTIGLEEELMLLNPESRDLVAAAPELIERLDGDSRFKVELPAAQIEALTRPCKGVPAAVLELATARADLARAADGLALLAGAGVHPFADPEGALTPGERYEWTRERFASVASTQLVFALQVHVAVGGAERTLAVYNALRGYLPLIAALAANGPFHGGRDTGLASARPALSIRLPRQGVPPAMESWDAFAEALRWGAESGTVPRPGLWWWELRPHVAYGTLEVRVPDTQITVADSAAVAALVHALVVWLSARHDAGERLPVHASWRIAENRWLACRYGVEGEQADLATGRTAPSRDLLGKLINELGPSAAELGCAGELAHARSLVERNGALRQREVAAESGLRGVADRLVEQFLA